MLEAHACGIPVVCPHTQGFCDTVAHKKDGFLYEIDESRAKEPDSLEQEEQLALHFLHLLRDDQDLRIDMGRQVCCCDPLHFLLLHSIINFTPAFVQGHEKVQNNSVFCVVGDLLSWYSHVRTEQKINLFFRILLCHLLLLVIVLRIIGHGQIPGENMVEANLQLPLRPLGDRAFVFPLARL